MCVVGACVCKDNSKVVVCGNIACVGVGWFGKVGFGFVLVGGLVLRNERTPARALPKPKLPYSDSILTDAHTLTIHITVYFILDSLTI